MGSPVILPYLPNLPVDGLSRWPARVVIYSAQLAQRVDLPDEVAGAGPNLGFALPLVHRMRHEVKGSNHHSIN